MRSISPRCHSYSWLVPMSAFDAVDGARSAASKCYRLVASTPKRFKEVRPGNDDGVWSFEGIGEDRRRNADKVDPGIGRTRMGQRIFECVLSIGTRSAHSIMASGSTAAQTGRTHDRTRPMLQLGQKVLAKAAPSTHDPKRTFQPERLPWRTIWPVQRWSSIVRLSS